MTFMPDIDRVIFQRSIWGKSYKDRNLESKRRSAIIWLRQCSKSGWCIDKIIGKK